MATQPFLRRRRIPGMKRRCVRAIGIFLVSSLVIVTKVWSFVPIFPTRLTSSLVIDPPTVTSTTSLFATVIITNSTIDTTSLSPFPKKKNERNTIRTSNRVRYPGKGDVTANNVKKRIGGYTPLSTPSVERMVKQPSSKNSAAVHRPPPVAAANIKTHSSIHGDSKKKDQKKMVMQPTKKTPQHEEFQWLNWVYYQWKNTTPGQLTDEAIVRQMIAAIPHWARRKSLSAAERAEELLERLVVEALAGNPHLTGACSLLTVSEFNKAMDAHGKIGNPSGVQRILRRMESLQRGGIPGDSGAFAHLRPDAFSMSILATALAKSRAPDAAQKAEAILHYMDLNDLVPNTVTYNAILNAIAVGNQVDKALKAEDLVQQMKERCEKGQPCEPDVYTYQSLIQAWSKTTLPGAPQKAEEILWYMDVASEQNDKLTPNAYCFTTVIHCWARSSEKNRARSAYNLLNTLMKRSQDISINPKKANQLRPNVKTFTAVLNACARPSDVVEALDAFAIAKLTMAELSVGVYGHPNFLSYAAFLSVCATALEAGPKRDRIVRETFKKCVEAGEVGTIVVEKLHAAASLDLLNELVGTHRNENGEIQVPQQWKANVKGEKASSFFIRTPKVTDKVVSTVSKSSQQRFGVVQQYQDRLGAMSGDLDEEIIWRNGSF
ncbi:PPR: pentatricopeptide repeat domain containing protein [Nitzschia inconspicua]|uniref:PPR: pentatricopeptide repeat domain containing protein n=1 Tax=Nitzschia inconspicua TaxID=303405 RepID=A0A9K3L810_9STRA|nr:PPR: pentatricopeptide repeat domain containing protein [Nitzschia inconspicua]